MKPLFFTAVLFLIGIHTKAQVTAQDGKTYKTVKIGNQTWMAENLSVSTYRNGDTIPQVQDAKTWSSLKTGAWCYYEEKKADGVIYGKLYNWYAVTDPRGLAPEGWHIASDADWTQLSSVIGGKIGTSFKIKSPKGWLGTGNGTNETGFSALPGGTRSIELFSFAGNYGYWWTSNEFDSYSAWNRFLSYNNNDIGRSTGWKQFGNSVRCVKGEIENKIPNSITENKKDGSSLIHDSLKIETPVVKETDNIYTVTIGEQNWMAQNLDVSKFQNGDSIPEARTNEEWKRAGKLKQPAWCHYNNDTANTKKYGKLYNWYAVTDKRGLAPKGFHIPDTTEWIKLINELGERTAGEKIKSVSGWLYKNDDSLESDFAGIPAGFRNSDGEFFNARIGGYWWSSSESHPLDAKYYTITYFSAAINSDNGEKQKGYSVRCIKD